MVMRFVRWTGRVWLEMFSAFMNGLTGRDPYRP
jgi:hypothetical protein